MIKKSFCCITSVSIKIIYGIALMIVISFYGHAQEMTLRKYTAKDGLPSTYVFGAYQDKPGYLWVGSPDGLSRFDGKYFTNYGLPDGLPDTKTLGGFMDSHLRYWACTTKGVAEFKGNTFINYSLSDSPNIRWVFQIFETKQGQLLSLTNAGIYQFNFNKWYKVKLYPGFEDHACRGMVEAPEGIYINYGNLLLLKKTDGTFRIIGGLKNSPYYYNYLSISGGEIFVSTADGMHKLVNQHLVKLKGALGRLNNDYTYYRDSKKRFWIANEQMGIQLLETGDTSHLKTIYKPKESFLPQNISEDKEGNIWVATASGLLRFSEMGFKIVEVPASTDKNILFNTLQPPSGPLLVNNGSLVLQAFENNSFTNIQLQRKSKTLLPNNELIIDNYAFDNKGRYWYSVRGFALVMQKGQNVYEQSNQLAHLGNEVFDVLYDVYRKKIIVAVGKQNYPCQFNDTCYSPLTVANYIAVKGTITHLHQCANGTVLFSTDQGLVYSIDKQNMCKLQLKEFTTPGTVSKFCNDPSGDVWIIYTGRGLRCYAWHKDSLLFKNQLTKANGLSSDNASSLCFDNRDNLWVSTHEDVAVFSKRINAVNKDSYHIISSINARDIPIGDSYDARLTKDLKGDIWLFSNAGLMCFYPDKINYNPPVPSIMIEEVRLNLQQTNWAEYVDSLSGIFQLPYHLKLSHDDNTVGIYYKGISSSGTDDIKYAYLLEGLNNFWSMPSANNFVSFVKLPPGKYTFKVKAQLPNTNWSEPTVFSFTIDKAFWQTWWFYTLMAIVLFTGIYMLFRFRLQQKISLLEMRNSISQDLHDEVGASISGINLLTQMAVEKLENNNLEEASVYLFKVKNYTRDVIEKLGDMVWIFNPQNDSTEKLLQRLKSFAISIALSKNIKLHFENDKESEIINVTIQQRKAIYLVSKEAMNNAFKYAGCNNIYYSLQARSPKWKLMIRDDGKGFIPEENKSGNGLKNMQARADEIKADFKIESRNGAGTIITLEF